MQAVRCGYGPHWLIVMIVLSVFLMTAFSCQTVPLTERQQLHLVSEGQIIEMSLSSYQQFLSEHKVVRGTPEARMVTNVGERIRNAVDRYLAQNDLSNRVEGYEWEFNLVEDKAMNAFAMPGGKVVVFTGILPAAQNETGLAVVMGHEISHVIAGHGNERMSQGLLAQMGGMALSIALAEKPAQTQQLFMAAFGIGAQVGFLLPYSRIQESEADHLGLIFMAMAGYDPHASVDFWQRMSGAQDGGKPPEFLSTHPSDRTRIDNLRKLIPEAMDYYTASHQ